MTEAELKSANELYRSIAELRGLKDYNEPLVYLAGSTRLHEGDPLVVEVDKEIRSADRRIRNLIEARMVELQSRFDSL